MTRDTDGNDEDLKLSLILLVLIVSPSGALAADKVIMMFPASPDLQNVSVFQSAKYKHYYSDAGLDVEFLAGRGGVDAGGRSARAKLTSQKCLATQQ